MCFGSYRVGLLSLSSPWSFYVDKKVIGSTAKRLAIPRQMHGEIEAESLVQYGCAFCTKQDNGLTDKPLTEQVNWYKGNTLVSGVEWQERS